MDTFKTGLSRARLKRERRIKNAILTILCMTHRNIAKRGGRKTTLLTLTLFLAWEDYEGFNLPESLMVNSNYPMNVPLLCIALLHIL